MVNIVLIEPEIPMNTGNIARTCAATGSRLHLVKPLGFDISDKAVKRAGLDYWSLVDISVYESAADFFGKIANPELWLLSTKAPRSYHEAVYQDGCYLVFGKETKGLDEELLRRNSSRCVRIPMVSPARSLNLANAVAVVAYEALRQQGYQGLSVKGTLEPAAPEAQGAAPLVLPDVAADAAGAL